MNIKIQKVVIIILWWIILSSCMAELTFSRRSGGPVDSVQLEWISDMIVSHLSSHKIIISSNQLAAKATTSLTWVMLARPTQRLTKAKVNDRYKKWRAISPTSHLLTLVSLQCFSVLLCFTLNILNIILEQQHTLGLPSGAGDRMFLCFFDRKHRQQRILEMSWPRSRLSTSKTSAWDYNDLNATNIVYHHPGKMTGYFIPDFISSHLRYTNCICLLVCLSVRSHVPKTARPNFTTFSVHAAYCCGAILLWRQCRA